MTEKEDQKEKKPLGLSKQVDVKKVVETGQVRQSFPHGRSKTVTVEVKRKRILAPGDVISSTPAAMGGQALPEGDNKSDASAGRLTNQEWDARLKAVKTAIKAEAEEAQLAEERALEHRRLLEEQRKLEEERTAHLEELAAMAESSPVKENPEPVVGEPAVVLPLIPDEENAKVSQANTSRSSHRQDLDEDDDEEARGKRTRAVEVKKPVPAAVRREERRRPNKITLSQALDGGEGEERTRSLASVRRAREKNKHRLQQSDGTALKVTREVVIPEALTVQDLANRMAVRGAEVVKCLMRMGMMVTINQIIDGDIAELIVAEFGHKPKRISEADVEVGMKGDKDLPEDLTPRAPVVTIMGHVDHGKTSLLDALRETDVAGKEAGGITQHIGAYQVTIKSGQKITFIDTPGHAAFTEMRARGANVTDIVVLVVAADDGIKEQTIEAIHHAKAAKVPIVVAINKMDKPDADPNRVRMELLQHEIVVEALGGDVLDVEVSAKGRLNLEKLEEAILLQAEILDLKANPNRSAEGVIIEARMERGRGSVATVLVQRGTLRVGDIFVAGKEFGRVRALVDERGKKKEQAGPSIPVEVIGLNGTPLAGDDFVVVSDEGRAREITSFRQRRQREATASALRRNTMEQMFSLIAAGEAKELPLIIKSDVQGSLEAITGSLDKIVENQEVSVRVLHAAVGGINESDVTLASASNAIIIGFNVRANPQARELARRDNVDIRYYSIIYDVIDDIKAALSGLLSPVLKEKFLGNAAIREVFNITKVGKVAGCIITDGIVKRGAKVRLLRDNVVIHEGSLKTLKRFKEEVKEVKEGFECGMAFENYHDIRPGDVIECFEIEEIARTL